MESNQRSTTDNIQPSKKKELPVPLILILVYLGYSILTSFWSLSFPTLMIGPFDTGFLGSMIFKGVSIVIMTICLIGLWKITAWGWKLSIGWFIFRILHTLFNTLISFVYFDNYVAIFKKYIPENININFDTVFMWSLILGTIFSILIHGLIIFYLFKKKNFFLISEQLDLNGSDVKQK